MTKEQRAKLSTVLRYILLVAVGFIMVYPLIWMVGATFKTNSEIFTSAWFWPKNPVFDGYNDAFKSYGGKIDLIKSMINTYKIVVPKVIFTLLSIIPSLIVFFCAQNSFIDGISAGGVKG